MAAATLEPGVLTCPKCRLPLPLEELAMGQKTPCPGCGTPLWVTHFPALHLPQRPGAKGEAILVEGEASCFYHPEKRAVVPCARCGRFLCQLCDITLGEEHVCSSCMHSGQTRGTLTNLQQRRMLWDSTALILAVLGLVPCFWYFTVATAPAAVVLGVIALKKPLSILRKNRWRAWLAIVLGLIETGVWVWLLVLFFWNILE